MTRRYVVLQYGYGEWLPMGSSESLSVAKSAYEKRRKRMNAPVMLVKVLETNTNEDEPFGDDIATMRDLEYDV